LDQRCIGVRVAPSGIKTWDDNIAVKTDVDDLSGATID
jgi:hypothetical protein